MRLGKHADLTGVALERFYGRSVPVDIRVVPAQAQFCEMCTDPGTVDEPNNQAAEYTVVGGKIGYTNHHLCQEHLLDVVHTSYDKWVTLA